MKISEIDRPVERTAGCLIRNSESERILLLRRSSYEDQPGQWCMPGGHLEDGENYVEAAVRECREETGLELDAATGYPICKVKTDWPTMVHMIFAFSVDKEAEPTLNWESDGFGWFNLDQLPESLHWTVETMLAKDSAAERLKNWIEPNQSLT